jgi:hypothetical protein
MESGFESSLARVEAQCTCAMSADNCGPEGCHCTTAIMDCAVHRDSAIGQAERFMVEATEEISDITGD